MFAKKMFGWMLDTSFSIVHLSFWDGNIYAYNCYIVLNMFNAQQLYLYRIHILDIINYVIHPKGFKKNCTHIDNQRKIY